MQDEVEPQRTANPDWEAVFRAGAREARKGGVDYMILAPQDAEDVAEAIAELRRNNTRLTAALQLCGVTPVFTSANLKGRPQ